jgi:hypothetical protein
VRITRARAAHNLAYIEAELARPDLSDDRRSHLEGMAAWYGRVLAGACKRCGRVLTDEESLARGYGSECARAVAVASIPPADPHLGAPAMTSVGGIDPASTS